MGGRLERCEKASRNVLMYVEPRYWLFAFQVLYLPNIIVPMLFSWMRSKNFTIKMLLFLKNIYLCAWPAIP